MHATGGHEETASPPPPASWARRHRTLLLIGVIVVGVLALAVVADWYSRNNELSALISRTDVADRPIERWTREAKDCSSQDCRQDVTADGLARVLAARVRIGETRVMPWHLSIKRAKERTLDYYDGYIALMKAYLGPNARYQIAKGELDAAFTSGRNAVRDAVPTFPLYDLESRVNESCPKN